MNILATSEEGFPQNSTLAEGQIFMGRYQILSVLGRGGVGIVYKARQMHMDKLVAIKTLLDSVVSADGESFQRFERESRTASKLDHVNIIRIFDFGKTDSGLVFLVMEYLGDRTLENLLIEKGRLDADQFLPIASQICDGLQNAHKHQVIHRDIKPSNIMLSKVGDGEECVKIVDFGLAKLSTQEAAQSLTQTGTIIGTPLFMSPEQCRGLALDHRSDIYSLGCVFYLMLTGRVPIQGATALDTLFQHTALRPKSFAEIGVGSLFSPRLEEVIFKALEKEPDMRHQSMLEFRTEIQKAIFDPNFRISTTQSVASSPSIPQVQIVTAEDARSSKYADLVNSTHTVVSINKSPESLRQLRGDDSLLKRPVASEPESEPQKSSNINKPAIIASAVAVIATGVMAAVLMNKPSPGPSPAVAISSASPTITSASPVKVGKAFPIKALPAVKAVTEPKTVTEHKAVVTAPKPQKVVKEHPAKPDKKVASDQTDFQQLPGLFKAGKDAALAQKWDAAQRYYALAVQLQAKEFGANDYRLFPTLSALMHAQLMVKQVDETRPNLIHALDIFSREQSAVLGDVSGKPFAPQIWRNMASVCRANGYPTRDLELLKWSADFFELARKAWKGDKSSAEYGKMCEDYCLVLELCGNRTKENEIRAEINLAPLPESTPVVSSKPERKNKQRDSVQHNGRMVIHSYRY